MDDRFKNNVSSDIFTRPFFVFQTFSFADVQILLRDFHPFFISDHHKISSHHKVSEKERVHPYNFMS